MLLVNPPFNDKLQNWNDSAKVLKEELKKKERSFTSSIKSLYSSQRKTKGWDLPISTIKEWSWQQIGV